MEAEIGAMWLPVKEHLEPSEEEGMNSLRASRRDIALTTHWFQTSGLQNCEREHFCF